MKNKNILPEKLQPLSGIIYFAIILLVAHFFWKFFVLGDESDTVVTFFGLDISHPFNVASAHVAQVTHNILNAIGFDNLLKPNNVVQHCESKQAVRVVWGCTGIKQAYIFFCIIAFYKGSWKNKLWFIPMGLLVIYLFNIFRIAFITAVIDNYPQYFDLLHEHIFKYAFYAVIFLMWVWWNEKFATIKKD